MRHKRSVASPIRRPHLFKPRPSFPRLESSLLDHLIESIPIGFAFIDLEFRYLRISQRFAEITGSPVESHIGRTVPEVVSAGQWRLLEPCLRQAFEGSSTLDRRIVTVLPSSPQTISHLVLSCYPIWDKGEICGAGLAIEDITHQVKEERERMRLAAQIQEAGAERRSFLTEMLTALTEGKLRLCESAADLPQPLNDLGPATCIDRDTLSMIRHRVMDAALWLGFSELRRADFVLAVGEALDNVLVHAGTGTAQVLVNKEKGTLQVRIVDSGKGIEESDLHRAALERGYTTAGTLGHGFFLILNTCDRTWLLTGPTGTTLVLEQDREEPLPDWLLMR